MRLTLVSHESPADAQHLAQALYGILMLLPQTDAFHLLKNRLQCVPNYWQQTQQQIKLSTSSRPTDQIDFEVLLQHFQRIQILYRQYKVEQRRQNVQAWEKNK